MRSDGDGKTWTVCGKRTYTQLNTAHVSNAIKHVDKLGNETIQNLTNKKPKVNATGKQVDFKINVISNQEITPLRNRVKLILTF